MSLLALLKGWIGESMGAAAHWAFLDKAVYKPLNNVTLNTPNGTTQIDHVVVSRFGVFVIEAKNMDGWIFGDTKAAQWSVVKPGRKYKIQNPLHQNHRHVRAVVDCLGVDQSHVHSLVMFWGECEFKTPMPSNVLREGYASYIKGFSRVVFTDQQVAHLVETLKAGAMPKSWATRQAHLASLQSRYASTTICPKCDGALVLRTAKSGANAGQKFYGCASYPKCKYTKPHGDGTS